MRQHDLGLVTTRSRIVQAQTIDFSITRLPNGHDCTPFANLIPSGMSSTWQR
jgi:hypothetical protein